MTEKRTSGLRVKSFDFNNESNILIENVDKSVDAMGAHMDSQEVLIDSSPQGVKQFLEETDKMRKTIHKIKEIWELESTPKNAAERRPSGFGDVNDNIYTNSEEGKGEERQNEI